MTDESTTITLDRDASRFILESDGIAAGVLQFTDDGTTWRLDHTVVDDQWEGRGFGSMLAKAGLDGAREAGRGVIARCSFVAAYVQRHHDWDDILVADS
ncbi:MAG: GNAT family N-acetyltransferase [Naasia sp.]